MTDAFAPLAVPTPSWAAEGAAFRLKVIPQGSAAPAFQPLQPAVRQAASCVHVEHSSGSPRVTLQRDGEQVTHIRVECCCGEVFELACRY